MRLFGLSLVALAMFALTSARGEELWFQLGGGQLKGVTCAECGRKAVQAMSKDKFLFAEVDAEGNVRGWNEKGAMAVLIWLGPDYVQFAAVAASRDNAEAKRVCDVVCTFLKEAPTDPKSPTRIGSADPLPKGKIPVIHFRHEQRAAVPTLRFFQQGASIAFLKQGLSLDHTEQTLVAGKRQGEIATSFIGPAKSGLSAHFGVIAISWDETNSSHLTDAVWREVVKVLFE